MNRLRTVAVVLLLAVACPIEGLAAEPAIRPNVLMIWADDLRPELACFGVDGVETPNIDRLAERSVCFNRAYCNIPVCGASRASVITGVRGTPTRYLKFDSRADEEAPSDTTPLHRLLRDAGYHTASFGKVLHVPEDSADGWSEHPTRPVQPRYTLPDNVAIVKGDGTESNRGPAWERANASDEELPDGEVMTATCEAITRLAGSEQPFFIATGFYKPHLPFIAPASYWDAYPVADQLLPSNYRTRPQAPRQAFTNWGELRNYFGIPKRGALTDADAREMIAGYRACVSYTDALIGRVLDSLDESGVRDNTVVVLLGDHGWQLGDHGMWCKHVCFERSMRTPLIVAAPMLEGFTPGESTDALTEFIDIYPTLSELVGVAMPSGVTGESFTGLLSDPAASHRDAAVGRFKIGDTIRTDRFRYTLYRRGGDELGHMLYDHEVDPNEDRNLADDPAYADVVTDLRQQLAEATGR